MTNICPFCGNGAVIDGRCQNASCRTSFPTGSLKRKRAKITRHRRRWLEDTDALGWNSKWLEDVVQDPADLEINR